MFSGKDNIRTSGDDAAAALKIFGPLLFIWVFVMIFEVQILDILTPNIKGFLTQIISVFPGPLGRFEAIREVNSFDNYSIYSFYFSMSLFGAFFQVFYIYFYLYNNYSTVVLNVLENAPFSLSYFVTYSVVVGYIFFWTSVDVVNDSIFILNEPHKGPKYYFMDFCFWELLCLFVMHVHCYILKWLKAKEGIG